MEKEAKFSTASEKMVQMKIKMIKVKSQEEIKKLNKIHN